MEREQSGALGLDYVPVVLSVRMFEEIADIFRYEHFPSRSACVEWLLQRGVDELLNRGDRLPKLNHGEIGEILGARRRTLGPLPRLEVSDGKIPGISFRISDRLYAGLESIRRKELEPSSTQTVRLVIEYSLRRYCRVRRW